MHRDEQRLLADSFGSGTRTSLVITLNPMRSSLMESESSLMFGSRALTIKSQTQLSKKVAKDAANQIDLKAVVARQEEALSVAQRALVAMEEELAGHARAAAEAAAREACLRAELSLAEMAQVTLASTAAELQSSRYALADAELRVATVSAELDAERSSSAAAARVLQQSLAAELAGLTASRTQETEWLRTTQHATTVLHRLLAERRPAAPSRTKSLRRTSASSTASDNGTGARTPEGHSDSGGSGGHAAFGTSLRGSRTPPSSKDLKRQQSIARKAGGGTTSKAKNGKVVGGMQLTHKRKLADEHVALRTIGVAWYGELFHCIHSPSRTPRWVHALRKNVAPANVPHDIEAHALRSWGHALMAIKCEQVLPTYDVFETLSTVFVVTEVLKDPAFPALAPEHSSSRVGGGSEGDGSNLLATPLLSAASSASSAPPALPPPADLSAFIWRAGAAPPVLPIATPTLTPSLTPKEVTLAVGTSAPSAAEVASATVASVAPQEMDYQPYLQALLDAGEGAASSAFVQQASLELLRLIASVESSASELETPLHLATDNVYVSGPPLVESAARSGRGPSMLASAPAAAPDANLPMAMAAASATADTTEGHAEVGVITKEHAKSMGSAQQALVQVRTTCVCAQVLQPWMIGKHHGNAPNREADGVGRSPAESDADALVLQATAPEVLLGSDRVRCSGTLLWSLGVLVHLSLTGEPPFVASTVPQLLQLVFAGGVAHPRLSPTTLSFLRLMLHPDPTKRPSANEVLAHPWMKAGHQDIFSEAHIMDAASASAPRARLSALHLSQMRSRIDAGLERCAAHATDG